MKKQPIVILHGWNLDGKRFLPLKTEFEKRGFDVYCPDFPGFGENKQASHYQLDDYVEFVYDYLKKNKLSKAILIGHSFGGRVGIKFAVRHPKIISGLILTGVPGFNPVPRLKVLFFLLLAKAGNFILSLSLLSTLKNSFQKLLYRAARATDFYNSNEKMRITFQNIIREKLDSYMTNINIPVILIWGTLDTIVPLSIAKKMLSTIKNCKLYQINNARHLVPVTHTIEFADITEKFLKGL